MTLPTPVNVYAVSTGTATIYPTVLKDREPTATDFGYPLLQRWVLAKTPVTAIISNITQANPCVVTANNNYSAGQIVSINSVAGMTQINGGSYLITAANSTTFTLNLNSSAFSAYAGGGIASVSTVAEYILTSITTTATTKTANWVKINAGIAQEDIQQLVGDTGSPTTINSPILDIYAQNLTSTAEGFRFVSGGTTVSLESTLEDGQLIIGSTGNPAVAANLTAGSNVTITNAPGQITVNAFDTGGAGIATGFYAYLSAAATDVTGDGTTYVIPYNTTLYNQNAAFSTVANAFIAPQNGIYQFFSAVEFDDVEPTHTQFDVELVVTGVNAGTYSISHASTASMRDSVNQMMVALPVQVEMTSGDTAKIQARVSGGAKVIDINGGSSTASGYFSGSLVQNTSTAVLEFSWQKVSTNTSLQSGYGYFVVAPGGAINMTLPAIAAQGDTFYVVLQGATSWRIVQQAGQVINIASLQTTPGVGGYLESTAQGDTVRIVCSTADTEFTIVSYHGNIQVV